MNEQQQQDKELDQLIRHLHYKELPTEEQTVQQVLRMDKKGFVIVKGALYYEGDRANGCHLAVPSHLQQRLSNEQHNGVFPGHFAYKNM